MQLHGPTEPVKTIPVERYGSGGAVALQLPGQVRLVIESAADADRLMIAASQAKDMLMARDDPAWAQRLPHLAQYKGGKPECVLCGIVHDWALTP